MWRRLLISFGLPFGLMAGTLLVLPVLLSLIKGLAEWLISIPAAYRMVFLDSEMWKWYSMAGVLVVLGIVIFIWAPKIFRPEILGRHDGTGDDAKAESQGGKE